MKKIPIIAGLLIAVGVFLLVRASKDMSTYGSFEDAQQTEDLIKIVGQLAKDKEMVYDPEKDPNRFSFFLRDQNGEERKVILGAAKPQDFEMSEQIVVTGKMSGEDFVATDILMKCPSKYKDEEVYIRSQES